VLTVASKVSGTNTNDGDIEHKDEESYEGRRRVRHGPFGP
jgi:hypothetical protein